MPQLVIEYREGPLGPGLLQEIARLYGAYDPKYRAPEFCEQLFNHTPAGGSHHVFAKTETGRYVGHLALIPLFVSTRAGPVLSAKAEAFCLEKEFRILRAATSQGTAPAAIALAQTVYGAAARAGIPLIHVITSEPVGLVHQVAGCRKLSFPCRHWLFFLRRPPWRGGRVASYAAVRCIHLAQKPMLIYSRFRARASRAAVAGVDDELLRIAATLRFGEPHQWSFSLDPKNLVWLNNTGHLGGARFPSGGFALWSRPDGRSGVCCLLAWYSPDGRTDSAKALLGQVISGSAQLGASLLSVPACAAIDSKSRQALAAACRGRWAFRRPRPDVHDFYVCSRDPQYLKGENFAFSPMFEGLF
jgi:hypothetical protein